jgi:hypothetical protein
MEMIDECKAIEERMEGIACRYRELTGTGIRNAYTQEEIYQVFEPLLKIHNQSSFQA